MVLLDYCDICKKKNISPPSTFCFYDHPFGQFVSCGDENCKICILTQLFSYEIDHSTYSKYTFLGNVNNIVIPRNNNQTVIGNISYPYTKFYIDKYAIKLNVSFIAYFNQVYQECQKVISYKKLSKYNINLPLILLTNSLHINKQLIEKFNKDRKYIFYQCLLTNKSTRLILTSYYKNGIFSKLSTELISCIMKFLYK